MGEKNMLMNRGGNGYGMFTFEYGMHKVDTTKSGGIETGWGRQASGLC
jgi:hypothetical protein